jgi:hypothetical protein
MMDAMAETIGLDQMIPTSAIHGGWLDSEVEEAKEGRLPT